MHKFKEINVTTFFNSCNIPIVICNLNLDIVEVNEKIASYIEYTRDELIGKNISFVSTEKGLSFNVIEFKKLISKKIDNYTFNRLFKTKTGKIISGAITVSLFEIDNEHFILGVFNMDDDKDDKSDIFKQSFSLVDKMLALNPDIHCIIDNNKNFVYENSSVINYLGYNLDDVGENNVVDFLKDKIDKDSLIFFNKDITDIDNLEGLLECEFQIESSNNEMVWLKLRSIELIRKDELNVNFKYVIIQDITRRKSIENELSFHNNFLEDITNLMPDVVFVYNISPFDSLYSNLRERTFLGFKEKDWKNLNSIKPHPDYEEYLTNSLLELNNIKEGEVILHEMPVMSKSGEYRWLLTKSKLFKRDEENGINQILTLISDVQDYRNAIENLNISENTNSAIINAIPDLILVVNKNGDYLYSFSGHDIKINSTNEVVGKNVLDVIEQPIGNIIMDNIERCINNDELLQIEFVLTDKKTLKSAYFSNYFSKISEDRAIILVRDITKRKEAENELSNKIKLLSDQNKKMEQFISKNTELERFAYILSHDLKEPLRGIGTIAEILENEIKALNNSKLETLTKFLIESSNRMNSMIEGILDYSKTSNDLIQYELVDVEKNVNYIINDLDLLIKETGVDIRLKKLPNIMGSEIQIRQLLQNLINNAIKFNINPSPYVEIGANQLEHEVVYYVKDNGIGIKKQFQESVFKMFRRLNSSKNFSGQGLGLSICKKIVERHNGKIWVETNLDDETGSIFYFSIPL